MPKIGLRTIKTAVAVTLGMLVYFIMFLFIGDTIATWYSPFFAGIAAAYSMQTDVSSSFRQAKIRAVGSLVGGLYGVVVVLLYETAFQTIVVATLGTTVDMLLFFLFVGLALVSLIYATVVMKMSLMTFVASLTFLSVTISTRNNLPIAIFASNRILSTIIGVMLALFVNNFRLHFVKNRNVLFVCGLDGLLSKKAELSGYARYMLNNLSHQGANITLATTKIPSTVHRIMNDIHLNLPLIIMKGAAIYDLEKNEYSEIVAIDLATREALEQYFRLAGKTFFTYGIVDGVPSSYHSTFVNQAERQFFEKHRSDFFINHVRGVPQTEDLIIFYLLIDTIANIKALTEDLVHQPFYGSIMHSVEAYEAMPEYGFVKIQAVIDSKSHALNHFSRANRYDAIIAFGTHTADIPMMLAADYAITLKAADDEVREYADAVLDSHNPDDMMREISRLFTLKKIDFIRKSDR